jgi:hypothetical protein
MRTEKQEREVFDMKKYKIVVSGKKYNEEYFFLTPAEGEIEEEVAAIMVEIKNGNISSMAVDEVDL